MVSWTKRSRKKKLITSKVKWRTVLSIAIDDTPVEIRELADGRQVEVRRTEQGDRVFRVKASAEQLSQSGFLEQQKRKLAKQKNRSIRRANKIKTKMLKGGIPGLKK